MHSFRGGVHVEEHKLISLSSPRLKKASVPKIVTIPVSQHLGQPAKPVVKTGDEVKMGTRIAEASGFISSHIHSSVSGKVVKIRTFVHPVLGMGEAIQIESDGKNTPDSRIKERKDTEKLSPEEIIEIVKDCGICGMGGATFPTHVKLSVPKGKEIDTLLINGAECEPYLTSDHMLMLNKPVEIVKGSLLLMKAVGAKNAIIAVEKNKRDALELIGSKLFSLKVKNIKTAELKIKYPQGAEKQLIRVTTKKKVPRGGLPLDIGVVVQNVGTAFAVFEAVYLGKPLYERVVTVTGQCVAHPGNVLARIGTPFKSLVGDCGNFLNVPGKVIMGGPMMGISQQTLDAPVVKGTSGVLLLPEHQAKLPKARNCIRCGRCVSNCPLGLVPTTISLASEKGNLEVAEEYGASDCMECGVCAYLCPSKIPLVQNIRIAKEEIRKRKRK